MLQRDRGEAAPQPAPNRQRQQTTSPVPFPSAPTHRPYTDPQVYQGLWADDEGSEVGDGGSAAASPHMLPHLILPYPRASQGQGHLHAQAHAPDLSQTLPTFQPALMGPKQPMLADRSPAAAAPAGAPAPAPAHMAVSGVGFDAGAEEGGELSKEELLGVMEHEEYRALLQAHAGRVGAQVARGKEGNRGKGWSHLVASTLPISNRKPQPTTTHASKLCAPFAADSGWVGWMPMFTDSCLQAHLGWRGRAITALCAAHGGSASWGP